jgi:hypothetical protein
MLATLHVGGQIETTTPKELHRALLDQDVRLRADLSGVKQGEFFLNSGYPGMGAVVYNSTGNPPQSPTAGFIWAVMSIGFELALSSQVRLYKGIPTGYTAAGFAPTGAGRLITTCASFVTPSAQFSKGQFTLKAGDTFTAITPTASANILSIWCSYIEVPAEMQGKLWL